MLALMSVATAEGSGHGGLRRGRRRRRRRHRAGGGRAPARRWPAGRQVVCITHLPQVASLAERHFRVVKRTRLRDAARPDVARTEVERLDRAELVEELCRMLGSDGGDEAARRHAENLLRAA